MQTVLAFRFASGVVVVLTALMKFSSPLAVALVYGIRGSGE